MTVDFNGVLSSICVRGFHDKSENLIDLFIFIEDEPVMDRIRRKLHDFFVRICRAEYFFEDTKGSRPRNPYDSDA